MPIDHYSTGKVSAELVELNGARVVCVHDLEERINVFSLHGNAQFRDQVVHLVDGQGFRAVQVEIIENLFVEVGVSPRELLDTSLDLGVEMLYRLSGGLGVVILGHLPGGFHHFDEVLIRGGAHGQVAIVVVKLFPSDDSVLVAS